MVNAQVANSSRRGALIPLMYKACTFTSMKASAEATLTTSPRSAGDRKGPKNVCGGLAVQMLQLLVRHASVQWLLSETESSLSHIRKSQKTSRQDL